MDKQMPEAAIGAPAATAAPTAEVAAPAASHARRLLAPVRRLCGYLGSPRRLAAAAALLAILGCAGWIGGWRVYGWYHRGTGNDLLLRNHCRDALGHYQAALTVWPDDPTLLLRATQAARRSGAYSLAEAYLNHCQTVAPLSGAADLERVLLRASRGEGDAVAGYCDAQLQQADADVPLICEAMIEGYLGSLRLPEASYYVDLWLQRIPEAPQALYMKGRIGVQAGNTRAAVELFDRVIALDPDHEDARWQLAQLYLDTGQAQEAMLHLETLRQRLPNNVLVQVALARCFDLLGRTDEAVTLLDDVLARHPRLVGALLERGRLAVRARDLARAEECLTTACRRDPGNQEAHYQLMLCLRGLGKTPQADAVMERMNSIKKDSARLRDIATGELSRRPRDAALHAEIGTLYMRLGELEQAVYWLESAVRLDPQQAEAQRALAQHYRALGQFGRAERHRALGDASGKAAP
jgi:tetratricopeptide (TPR) repeat protein